jgi:Holliday junction DNA helicase RuvA
MISFLSGIILHIEAKYLILNVNGVGYKVFATNEILSNSQIENDIEIFIYTSVKEDSITLYGFKTTNELKFFEQLLSVSGIGPKTALEILNHPIQITKTAIFTQDTTLLTKIPGLGKKTAERLILELKNKIEPDFVNLEKHNILNSQTQINEAILALESLGYQRYDIMKTLQNLDKNLKETEDIVKWFLGTVTK